MINELDNPFSVTKATEFSDIEIKEYWVNFNPKEDVSIDTILNPNEYMPKYIIGGKGCGKTHILRYFSFPLQKIKYSNDISLVLSNDKYIGLYSILNGLNSSRFDGKGIDESQWSSIFEYYFELYICDKLLHAIKEIFTALQLNAVTKIQFVKSVLAIFRNYKALDDIMSLDGLIEFLFDLRNKIDSEILNAAFTRKLNYEEVKILFSPSDLIFGIPNIIASIVPSFSGVKFIYILDEYEKLFEWQKKFINTLVWDKKTPVTFWIGARRYGYTTRETKSGESMKNGSEFQEVNLDEIIRSNDDIYRKFAHKLYTSRLDKYYLSKNIRTDLEILSKRFCDKFEKNNDDKIISEIIAKNKNKEFKHIKELRKKLETAIREKQALELKSNEQVDEVINQIKFNTDNNPLELKYKTFLFYQLWYRAYRGSQSEKKLSNMIDILNFINEEYSKLKNGEKGSFDDIREKRKKDFIAQLTKENNVKNTEHSGVDRFVELSQGNPRTFILILKKVIEYSKIRGERPLEDGSTISLDSQYMAVYDTAKWFYEDAEVFDIKGKHMYASLKYLTEYLMLERFCDKPVDTTISCFYIKEEDQSEKAINIIELMKVHSVLIEDPNGRLGKNSGIKERLFQLNKVLAPLWNLPIAERGTIYLKKDIAESIFNSEYSNDFESFYNKRKGQLNAPDFIKSKGLNEEITLF